MDKNEYCVLWLIPNLTKYTYISYPITCCVLPYFTLFLYLANERSCTFRSCTAAPYFYQTFHFLFVCFPMRMAANTSQSFKYNLIIAFCGHIYTIHSHFYCFFSHPNYFPADKHFLWSHSGHYQLIESIADEHSKNVHLISHMKTKLFITKCDR